MQERISFPKPSIGSVEGLEWTTSTRCESHQCVELARTMAGMAIRNNTLPQSQIELPREAWMGFMRAIQNGELVSSTS